MKYKIDLVWGQAEVISFKDNGKKEDIENFLNTPILINNKIGRIYFVTSYHVNCHGGCPDENVYFVVYEDWSGEKLMNNTIIETI